jgi:hypothetical protein
VRRPCSGLGFGDGIARLGRGISIGVLGCDCSRIRTTAARNGHVDEGDDPKNDKNDNDDATTPTTATAAADADHTRTAILALRGMSCTAISFGKLLPGAYQAGPPGQRPCRNGQCLCQCQCWAAMHPKNTNSSSIVSVFVQ